MVDGGMLQPEPVLVSDRDQLDNDLQDKEGLHMQMPWAFF